MVCVQAWEGQLAALVGAASLKPSRGRKVALERAVRSAVKQSWHLLHKASASELRNLLRERSDPAVVSEDLLTEIGELIGWRDFLAHDYLSSRLIMGQPAVSPRPEHVIELLKLGQAFSESAVRLGAVTAKILEAIPPPEDMPEGVREGIQRMSLDLAQTQPAPFTGLSSGDEAA